MTNPARVAAWRLRGRRPRKFDPARRRTVGSCLPLQRLALALLSRFDSFTSLHATLISSHPSETIVVYVSRTNSAAKLEHRETFGVSTSTGPIAVSPAGEQELL